LQDWVLQRRFRAVPGVIDVTGWGGKTKTFELQIDFNKLIAYGLTLPQVIQALGNSNINVGGNTVDIGAQSAVVRGVGLIRSMDELGSTMLTQNNGSPVLVRDIANVIVGNQPRLGIAGRDFEDDIVQGIVLMRRGEQSTPTIRRVEEEVDRINNSNILPPGVRIERIYDRKDLIDITTHTVLHNMVFGIGLIFLLQWIFLGNLRSALIVGATIPFALFFAVGIMVLRGESANLLSVGAIDFGLIVDPTVIMVERIYRQLSHEIAASPMAEDGLTGKLRAIRDAARRVSRSIFFAAGIIIAAFIPLFTLSGVEGHIFGPMAKTYAYALAGGLFATFTIIPALSAVILPEHVNETETWAIRWISRLYQPILRRAVAHKSIVIGIAVALFALAAIVVRLLGLEFLPQLEEGNLWIRATMPPTISLAEGNQYVNRMRVLIKSFPEVISVVSQHGRPDDGSDAAGFFNAEFFVPLKPFDEWPVGLTKDKLIEQLQGEFNNEFVGIDFNFSQYIQDNVEEGLSGVKGANSAKIVGPDLATLESIARSAMAEMKKVPGITDLGAFWVLGQPNLNIRVDRRKAARYGLSVNDVNSVVQAALGGTTATTLLESDRQFPVVVRLAAEFRNNVEDVRNLRVAVQTASGNAYIPLGELASVTLDTGASYIFRERNQRFVPIKFSVRGRDLAGAVEEAQQRIAENVKLPNGYRIEWSGEFEWLQEAKERLAVILPITLIMIMILLYTLFNSIRDTLLALFGLPFAICGGILALYITGLDFSVSAAIGFISLLGVSVMSGILIINGYYRVAGPGMSAAEAMFQAVQQQMRPILMMTLSACIGLLPAAISTGIGSQVQRPLATVIVGGMLVGPIMLLVVVPALQSFFLGRVGGPATPRDAG
jgi:cobalt-zinc-cadmium resistance protein CzcA